MTMKQSLPDILELDPELAEFWVGYIQAMGITGRAYIGPDANCEPPMFEGDGDFDENWDVWEEVKDLISDEQVKELLTDCYNFLNECRIAGRQTWDEVSGNLDRAGADFHLTRSRHGAGFWDGDWELGNRLTEMCKPYGTCEFEVLKNSDGKIVEIQIMN